MTFGKKTLLWLGLGLDVAGVALVATSLAAEAAETLLPVGLVCLIAGALLVARGARGTAEGPEIQASQQAPPAGWKPEPELQQPPPRRVRLTPLAWLALLSWVSVIAVVGWYAYQQVYALNPAVAGQRVLDEVGLRTQAQVIRKEIRAGESGRQFYLAYSFEKPDGGSVRSSVRVRPPLFDRFSEGDPIEVYYLAEDPLVHYAPALTRRPFALELTLLLLLPLLAALLFLDRRRRLHRRLVREGKPVPGVVRSSQRRGRTRSYEIEFEVQGQKRTLKAVERSRRELGQGPATILYDPRDPVRAILYSASLYRAAAR